MPYAAALGALPYVYVIECLMCYLRVVSATLYLYVSQYRTSTRASMLLISGALSPRTDLYFIIAPIPMNITVESLLISLFMQGIAVRLSCGAQDCETPCYSQQEGELLLTY